MRRRSRSDYSDTYITTYICREVYDEVNDEEYCDEFEIKVEGTVSWGEAPSWGYYGGSPGAPDDAEVGDIYRIFPVQGPPIESRAKIAELCNKNPYPIGTVEVEWDGELTKDEEERIRDELVEAARRDAEEAKVDAYIDRYDYP